MEEVYKTFEEYKKAMQGIGETKALKYLYQVSRGYHKLQEQNQQLKNSLDLKKGSILARQNIEFCNENKQLKELCNKYEEEHEITFQKWLKDRQQIDKALEYIEQTIENNKYFYMSTSAFDKAEAMAEDELCNKLKQILKGDENDRK